LFGHRSKQKSKVAGGGGTGGLGTVRETGSGEKNEMKNEEIFLGKHLTAGKNGRSRVDWAPFCPGKELRENE